MKTKEEIIGSAIGTLLVILTSFACTVAAAYHFLDIWGVILVIGLWPSLTSFQKPKEKMND